MEPQGDRQNSSQTLYFDFDFISVLNVWTRHQLNDIKLVRVLLPMITQIVLHLCECLFLTAILICQLNHKEKYAEFVCTVLVWIFTYLLTIFVKMSFERCDSTKGSLCSNQVGGFRNAALVLLKPFKYLRMLYFRQDKVLGILGKNFMYGDTVSREEFDALTRCNREEFVSSRDDLHDAFLRRLPMALLQFHYFAKAHHAGGICTMAYPFQFLLVVVHLISTVTSYAEFEWKRDIYLDTLHVQSYVDMNNRFMVPAWSEKRISHLVKLVSLTTAILARFFLVSFATSVGIGYGVACLLIMFLSNWAVIGFFPEIHATVRNLPWGITTTTSYTIDRWINTFSGIFTRCHQLSQESVKVRKYRFRIPLFIAQLPSFVLAFLLVYCYMRVMKHSFSAHHRRQHQSIPIYIINDTICENPDSSSTLQSISKVFYRTVQILNALPHDSWNGFDNVFSLHWSMLLVHIVVTSAHNLYISLDVDRVDTKEDVFPALVCLDLYKKAFRKIFEIQDPTRQASLLARILFLISIDLRTFNELYHTYRAEDSHVKNSADWWHSKITYYVEKHDPTKTRYRDYSSQDNSLTGLPIEVEIIGAIASLQHLSFIHRLNLLCIHRIDRAVTLEMTSRRLEATIEMLQLSKNALMRMRILDIDSL